MTPEDQPAAIRQLRLRIEEDIVIADMLDLGVAAIYLDQARVVLGGSPTSASDGFGCGSGEPDEFVVGFVRRTVN